MKKRNILVILCDQLRKDFLPLYGAKAIKTPNIDRITQMGVVFDRAITVSTVCAPARASMMTGRYVSDHQVWTNDIPFRPGMDTIACCMNDLDYNTGCFGKLHHFPSDDSKGFKTSYQMEAGRLKEKDPYFAWLKERHPEIDSIFNYDEDGFTFNFSAEDYYEHYLADRTIEFMENAEEQPFFAWLSFHGPHTPYGPPKEVSGTVLDIAKADKGIGYSRSLIGMLNKAPIREVNYSEFCDSIKTVENRQYRFSYYPFAGERQLFDLQADPDWKRKIQHFWTITRYVSRLQHTLRSILIIWVWMVITTIL